MSKKINPPQTDTTKELLNTSKDVQTKDEQKRSKSPYVKKGTSQTIGRLVSSKKKKEKALSNRKTEFNEIKSIISRGFVITVDPISQTPRQYKLDSSGKEYFRAKKEEVKLEMDVLKREIADLKGDIKILSKKKRSALSHKRRQFRKDFKSTEIKKGLTDEIKKSSAANPEPFINLQNKLENQNIEEAKEDLLNFLGKTLKISNRSLKNIEGNQETLKSVYKKIMQLELEEA